MNAVR